MPLAPYTVVLLDDAHQRAVLKTVGAPAVDKAFPLACAAYRAEVQSDDPGFDHAAFAENVECVAVFAGAHPSLFALDKRAEERPAFAPFTVILLDDAHDVVNVRHTYTKTPFDAFYTACELYDEEAGRRFGTQFDSGRFWKAARCLGVFEGWLKDLSPDVLASGGPRGNS